MKKLLFLMGLCLSFGAEAKQGAENTAAVKRKIIQQSIERYPGNCPCPYNTARNGSRCAIRKMSVSGWSGSIKGAANVSAIMRAECQRLKICISFKKDPVFLT